MTASLAVLLAFTLATACTPSRSATPAGEPTPDRSGIVIRGSEMSAGTLLDGLRTRVPAIMIGRQSGACPAIIFRGQRSMLGQGNPSVYVDNTLMSDTCILAQIPTADVDWVEVYPGDSAGKAGMQRNPFGSIFVYRLRR
jgi:hypothetical protein